MISQWYGHWKHWSSSSFFLSFFLYLILHFLWSETKLRSINMQKSTRTIISLLDLTSLVNIKNYYMAKRTFLQHQSRRFQVGKIGRAHLSCSNSQWEHNICLNHLASHIHCNSRQNKLCLWWIVTILHTLDLSKSLCFKRFFSYKKRKNETKSTIN